MPLVKLYPDTLAVAYRHIKGSADFVMYWWSRAAEIVARPRSTTRRFGFVTTNSITQVFNRRVVAYHLGAKKPVSILMAIPDHPWTKATLEAAAVRIAMTVGVADKCDGLLRNVQSEADLDTDSPVVEFSERLGRINADLSIGADLTRCVDLSANAGIASNGVLLAGRGFLLSRSEAGVLGFSRRSGLSDRIRPYFKGRDLQEGWSGRPRLRARQTGREA